MSDAQRLKRHYELLLEEGRKLAGGLGDLAQRATVYHHLYEHSGGNHIFPLIAAHGALWARGWFAFGMRLGWCFSWQYLRREQRLRKMQELRDFADAFREVNRRVCIDTYVSYHFAIRFGSHALAAEFVRPNLLGHLNRLHAARRSSRELADEQKREIFKAHFLDEQQRVVGPALHDATAAFAWPLIKAIAVRPVVKFAYFPGRQRFWFRNFLNREERIARGLMAFDVGASIGWWQVEAKLADYDILPHTFFAGSAQHFAAMRHDVLAA